MRTQDYLLLLSMILILLQFGHEFIKTYFTLLYPSLHQRDFQHLINKQKIIIILWSQAFASPKHLQNSVCFSIYIQELSYLKTLTLRKPRPQKSINSLPPNHTHTHTHTHSATAFAKEYANKEKRVSTVYHIS